MTTIALFGGSFNPPHIAHAMVCLYVLETTNVDRVVMVPALRHAFDKQLVDFEHRYQMCRIAASIFGDRVQVSRVEERMGGESRTFHTIERLAVEHPDWSFRLVIGSDILEETHKWYRWDDVAKLAPPIVVARKGYRNDTVPGVVMPEFSSTEVREKLARGEDAVPLLSRAVMDYIAERGLYR